MFLPHEAPEEYRFHERFKYFIDIFGLKQKNIAKQLDVTDGAVNKWKDGTRFPKDDLRLLDIAEILEVNIVDLFPDSKKNRKKIVIEELNNNFDAYIDHIPNVTLPKSIKKIPFNHGNPTANKIVMENQMQNAEHIYVDKLMLSREYQEAELKAVAIIGDAMAPYLNQGDVAIYSPTDSYISKGKYVINSRDGLEVVSIERLKTCGSLILAPENPTYSTEKLSAKDASELIEFVGLVIERIVKN